jgi:O-antigen/teichoic acid export membrane protein
VAQQPDPSAPNEPLRALVGIRLLLMCAFVVVLPIVAILIGYGPDMLPLVALLGSAQVLMGSLLFVRAVHQGRQRFVLDGFLSVLDKFILIGCIGFILLWQAPSNIGYGVCMLISIGASFSLALFVLLQKGPSLRPSFLLASQKRVLAQTIPFALMVGLITLNERLNPILLERLVSDNAAGLYSAAYRWVIGLQGYVWIIAVYFFARFAKLGRTATPEGKFVLQQAIIFFTLPIALAAALLEVYPGVLVKLLTRSTPAEIAEVQHLLQILTLAMVPNALVTAHGTWLSANGYAKDLALLLGGATVLHVAGQFVALGTNHWQWIAYVYAAFHWSLVGGYLWMFHKRSGQGIQAGLLVRALAAYGCALLAFWLCRLLGLGWGTGIAIALPAVYLIGIPKELRKKILSSAQLKP